MFEEIKKFFAYDGNSAIPGYKINLESTNKNLNISNYSLLIYNLKIGIFASTADALISHPLFVMKTRQQCNYTFTLDPKILYRGVIGNATSLVPAVSSQIALNAFMLQQFSSEQRTSLPIQGLSSFIAGVFSSVMSTPAECILVQQQKTNKKFIVTAKEFAKQRGVRNLYAGFFATALRSGVVSSGFITQMPYLKSWFENKGCGDTLSSLAGGSFAGVISAVGSHPFDTIKTLQQKVADVEQKSFNQTTKHIFSKNGLGGFFKGVTARGTRVVLATTVLGHVNQTLRNNM